MSVPPPRPSPDFALKVDVHDQLEAVGAAEWDRLHATSRLRAPFLSWTWQREWVRAFVPDGRLELRLVRDGDGPLVALLPLFEAAPGRLELVGGADVSDYLDLVAVAGREEEAWAALLQARAGERVTWQLHAVPEASPTVTAIAPLAETVGLTATVTVEERCPVLDLPSSWDAYLMALSGKHRHELARKTRRLERAAPDARPVALASAADVAARLDDFLDLHRRSRVGKARFMDARMEGFFRAVTTALAARDAVRLWFLDVPDGALATFLCLEWEDTVGLYNSGFAPAQAALAPGLVLLGHVLRDAIERGKRRFDFLRGEERYKYEFGPRPEAVCAVTIA